MTADARCEELARTADAIAAEHPDWPGDELLVELALRVAGIRRGPLAVLGLLAWRPLSPPGRRLPARSPATGPARQTRHFAGIARAVTVFGAARTEWLSVHVRRDAPDSPDGRLTSLAVEFAVQLLDGSLATQDAGEWIRRHVCASSGG